MAGQGSGKGNSDMEIVLTREEASLIVGIIVKWRFTDNPSQKELELAKSIYMKIIEHDRRLLDMIIDKEGLKYDSSSIKDQIQRAQE